MTTTKDTKTEEGMRQPRMTRIARMKAGTENVERQRHAVLTIRRMLFFVPLNLGASRFLKCDSIRVIRAIRGCPLP